MIWRWTVGAQRYSWPCCWWPNIACVAHERLVMTYNLKTVVKLPTESTEILEACQVATEIGTLFKLACRAQCILQVGIHLNLLVKLLRLDLNEGCSHCPHVGLSVVKSHSSTTYRILVFISINTRVNYPTKQVIEDMRQSLGVHHSVQSANKYSVVGL